MTKRDRDSDQGGREGRKSAAATDRGSVEREKEKGEGKSPRRPFDSFRENLEAVAVAVVLALIIRHFSVEAFEIPTGSMAPTLFGIHTWVQCPNCDTHFNMSIQTDQETGQVTSHFEKGVTVYKGACPKCKLPHHRAYHASYEQRAGSPVRAGDEFICPHDRTRWQGDAADFDKGDYFTEKDTGPITCPICWFDFEEVIPNDWWHRTGGHKILVNKFAYKVGRPERWDVIVFQFDRETNYIKRLIGKPGEEVEFKAGDLYIDGRIERKSKRPEIQEVLWTKIADLDVPERGYQKTPAWKEVYPPGNGVPAGSFSWIAQDRRWSVNTGPAGGKTAALRYQRPIVDYYNYNVLYFAPPQRRRQPLQQVGDKKVAFGVRPPRDGKGWVGAEIQKGDFCFQLRIPVGKPDPANRGTLRRLERPADGGPYQADRPALPAPAGRDWPSAEVALRPDALSRVEFENADDRLAVRIDGREVMSQEYDGEAEIVHKPEENGLFLLAGGGAEVNLESIRVYRDIYYTGGSAEMSYASNGQPIRLKKESKHLPDSKEAWVQLCSEAMFQGRTLTIRYPRVETELIATLADDRSEDFGKQVRSLRWQIPVGWEADLHSEPSFKGDAFPLIGTGKIEENPDLGNFVASASLRWDGGENEYFACGDNSPASSDGRYWGSIPERNMMGQALLVFWPLWPANWQFKIIR